MQWLMIGATEPQGIANGRKGVYGTVIRLRIQRDRRQLMLQANTDKTDSLHNIIKSIIWNPSRSRRKLFKHSKPQLSPILSFPISSSTRECTSSPRSQFGTQISRPSTEACFQKILSRPKYYQQILIG